MGKLLIGQKIKKFRRDRDLTQEELAGHLGVSFQSISKWERGEGYPDITLLPALAHYFGVTADELLGIDEAEDLKVLAGLEEKWEENRRQGKHLENVHMMRNALKSYPNNELLLVQLSASLERLDGTEKEKREFLRQSIEIQKRILRYAPDSEIRCAVMFNIADAYHRFGDLQKAVEYARKLPTLYKTRENALVHILEDAEEKKRIAETAVEELRELLSFHLRVLDEINQDKRCRLRNKKKIKK